MSQQDTAEAISGDEMWQRRAEIALSSLRAARQLSTYAELAETSAIPAPHRIHKLALWLEQTMEADAKAGLPLRAAVIISKQRGIPAPGFFAQAKALSLYEGPETGAEAAAFHQACLQALF